MHAARFLSTRIRLLPKTGNGPSETDQFPPARGPFGGRTCFPVAVRAARCLFDLRWSPGATAHEWIRARSVRQPMQGWSIDVSALALVAVLVPLLRVLVRRLRRLHVVSPLVTAAAEFEPAEPAPSKAPLKPTRTARELPATPPRPGEAAPRLRARTLPPVPRKLSPPAAAPAPRGKARTSPPKPRRSGKRRRTARGVV